MKIDKVVIACFKKDLFLVRSCVASVRYWYPDVEIFLLKDYIKGDFSTREMETHWGVKVFKTSRRCFGWPWSKLEVILAETKTKCLFLDSDTVLLGPILDKLNAYADDFIVTGARGASDSRLINTHYLDIAKVQEFDPDYRFPGFGFNGGQLVITSGMLKKSDFIPVIEFDPAITNKYPNIFKHGDQGVLNYVLAKACQTGRIKLTYADFWIWPELPEAAAISLQSIARKEGIPFILHWAGIKPTDFRKYARYDILKFYNDYYYSRVPLGGLKRFLRYCSQLVIVWLKILKYKVLRMPHQ